MATASLLPVPRAGTVVTAVTATVRSLAMDSTLLTVDTAGRTIVDLTGAVREFCAARGDGLVHVFAPHATAGLALMEVGSGSERDLAETLTRLLPATTATDTVTAPPATAPTTCCRH
jgi:hypothetical protein